MKIGIDIRTLMDARPSGVSEYTFNLIKRMLELDAENEYQLFYNCWGDCPNIPKFDGGKVKVVKYNYPNKIFNYFLVKILNYPKIDEELDTDIFFMPHINFIGLTPHTPLSKGGGGRLKRLITVHDLSFLRHPEFFNWRKNFWHRTINVKKLLKKFDAIAAISENTKRDIVELCDVDASKVKVIYSGVGEEYRKITNDQFPMTNKIPNPNNQTEQRGLIAVKNKYNLPGKFILFLGTVEPRKNVAGIIMAYNKLRVTSYALRDYKLIIAGERGWKSKNIYREREKSEFKSDIKFLDYVDAEDKVYLYNLAGVFVYPSFYEGFGLPPLEAMACGTPVITSYAASLPEIVGDAGLMVDPYNINDIARALEIVLTDENLKNKLIARGLERIGNFSWGRAAGEYLELLKFSHG